MAYEIKYSEILTYRYKTIKKVNGYFMYYKCSIGSVSNSRFCNFVCRREKL